MTIPPFVKAGENYRFLYIHQCTRLHKLYWRKYYLMLGDKLLCRPANMADRNMSGMRERYSGYGGGFF